MRTFRIFAFVLIATSFARAADQQPGTASASRTFVSPSGVTMKVLVDGKDLRGDEAEVVELTFPPNSDSGDHRHAVTETFYVLEGEMEQVINGTPVKLVPGSAVSLRATDTVRHKSGPKGARVLVVWAPGGEIARVVGRWKAQ